MMKRDKLKYLIVFLFFFQAITTFAQVPHAFRWDNCMGFWAGGGYGNMYQFSPPVGNYPSKPGVWYGAGIKGQFQFTMHRRLELSLGGWQRSSVYTDPPSPFWPSPEISDIQLYFINVYARYKFYLHHRKYSLYAAPGITMDVELNHPVLRSNSSGVGVSLTAGWEKRLNKRVMFFAEADARVLSILHFKKEEYPWRHAGVNLAVGFSFIL